MVVCRFVGIGMYVMICFLMIRRPPRSTRTYTLFPYTTLFRSSVLLRASRHASRSAVSFFASGMSTGSPASPPVSTYCPHFGHCSCCWVVGASSRGAMRSEEHTSELQSLMRISYAVFCLKKNITTPHHSYIHILKLSYYPQ